MERKNTLSSATPVLLTLAGLSVAIIAFATSNIWIPWTDEHDGLASWVQAIFSVIAILASLLLVERSALHARKLESDRNNEEEKRMRLKAHALGILLRNNVQTIAALTAVTPLPNGRTLDELEAASLTLQIDVTIATMQSFPAERLPTRAMNEFLILSGLAANSKQVVDALMAARLTTNEPSILMAEKRLRDVLALVVDHETGLSNALGLA